MVDRSLERADVVSVRKVGSECTEFTAVNSVILAGQSVVCVCGEVIYR